MTEDQDKNKQDFVKMIEDIIDEVFKDWQPDQESEKEDEEE